jgi:biopolymer transport protein ExbD
MKFPRNARIFRGQLDVAPFATVFFLLVIFMLLASLHYTPGVLLRLPTADNLPGIDKPTISVAIDENGRLYFENEWIEEKELKHRLKEAVTRSQEPLSLLVEADERVTEKWILQLALLAREVGISEGYLATMPRAVAAPARRNGL